MWIAQTKLDLLDRIGNLPRPIILVPTMGALHTGHESLIRLARERAAGNGSVLVSIFVNPIQFDRNTDLEKYPRPLDADLAICEANQVDGIFLPSAGEMYQPDRSVTVIENRLSAHLCGATRPGHFDGVCTVVLKLFNLTQCDSAVFGEKDFQQLAIIRRMVRDLDLGVEIIEHPTIREPDGLALSSRNRLLEPEHRADAPRIREALLSASRQTEPEKILQTAQTELEASPYSRIDYLSLVDAESLEPVADISPPCVLACAVYYGDVRLIDHITIHPRNS